MRRFAGILLLVLVICGCGHQHPSANPAAGESVAVLVEPGLKSNMNGAEEAQYRQVADYMRKDLVTRLQRQGYEVEVLHQRSDFTPASGQHLLAVEIERYSPGSKAARILVGFGAGATSLDIAYTMVHGSGKTLVSATDGVGSSRDWHFCCRALNERLVETLALELADA
ncbi:MAG: DUF4410 domain-containing protein [Thermodesulfobacteriota bacterium]